MQASESTPATSRSDKRKMNSPAVGDDSWVRGLRNDDRRKQPMALFERILPCFWDRQSLLFTVGILFQKGQLAGFSPTRGSPVEDRAFGFGSFVTEAQARIDALTSTRIPTPPAFENGGTLFSSACYSSTH